MRLLLDTHAFIWWDGEPNRLSARVRTLCADPANELFFSVASAWEMQIKMQLGKLALRMPLQYVIERQVQDGLRVLDVSLPHIFELQHLPPHHGDPFDRMIVAQALAHDLTLVSSDRNIRKYGVRIFSG